MTSLLALFQILTTIADPATQLFIALLVVGGVAGLSLYAVILALRHARKP